MRVKVGMWHGQAMGELRGGWDGDGEVARRTVGYILGTLHEPNDQSERHAHATGRERGMHAPCAWRTRRAKAISIWGGARNPA